MTSRSSSNNQLPRSGSVKLGAVANVTDFPPLNGNANNLTGTNGAVNNGARAGAWGREGSPASLFGSVMGGNPVAPGGNAVGANAGNPLTGGINAGRFEEVDSFERPAPKSFGLYNPNTGTGPAALPVQVRTALEGGTGPGAPGAQLSTAGQQGNGVGDALAEQVAKLSVADGGKVAGSA